MSGGSVLALKDEAKALLEQTPGLQLPHDLLLYARTLSYGVALGEELAPEVDMMKLAVPYLLQFLAASDR
jgi:predicted unusual protein kinase regulating ubiquinone biosynthesis (AarF/ABC1/UbiB family)